MLRSAVGHHLMHLHVKCSQWCYLSVPLTQGLDTQNIKSWGNGGYTTAILV